MQNKTLHALLRYAIAAVWAINGLYCKVLDGVPRHRLIVARILGEGIASPAVFVIGLSEIVLAVWILSRIRPAWCAAVQIGVILTMNALEFVCAPDLLLFGRLNIGVALLFCLVIYLHTLGAKLKKPLSKA
jgi:hypothetical protein